MHFGYLGLKIFSNNNRKDETKNQISKTIAISDLKPEFTKYLSDHDDIWSESSS